MIKKLGIENFKAFGAYQEIDLTNLTIISGINSSGKSSIYQALLLLAQSENTFVTDKFNNVVPTLNINGDFVKFGTSSDILHDKKLKFIRFLIEWEDGTTVETCYDLQTYHGITGNVSEQQFAMCMYSIKINNKVELTVKRIKNHWEIYSDQSLVFGEYKIMDIVEDYIKDKTGSNSDADIEEIDEELEIEDDLVVDTELNSEEFGGEWTFLPKVTFSGVKVLDFVKGAPYSIEINMDSILQCINPMFVDVINIDELKIIFKKDDINTNSMLIVNTNHFKHQRYTLKNNHILWLPPFRGYPKRVYSALEDENPLYHYNINSNKRIYYNYDFSRRKKIKGTLSEAITYWLVDHFKIADKIDVNDIVPGLLTEIYLTICGERISINNVGFGASQIVPVIFRLLLNNDKNISIVDEPEIHLHPSVQSRLADFFLVMALTGRHMMIETHSEYILDKLIYLTLKHEKMPSNLSMYWVKRNINESSIERIKYDDLGFIINQPEDFLVEKSKLVEMLTEARMGKLK